MRCQERLDSGKRCEKDATMRVTVHPETEDVRVLCTRHGNMILRRVPGSYEEMLNRG